MSFKITSFFTKSTTNNSTSTISINTNTNNNNSTINTNTTNNNTTTISNTKSTSSKSQLKAEAPCVKKATPLKSLSSENFKTPLKINKNEILNNKSNDKLNENVLNTYNTSNISNSSNISNMSKSGYVLKRKVIDDEDEDDNLNNMEITSDDIKEFNDMSQDNNNIENNSQKSNKLMKLSDIKTNNSNDKLITPSKNLSYSSPLPISKSLDSYALNATPITNLSSSISSNMLLSTPINPKITTPTIGSAYDSVTGKLQNSLLSKWYIERKDSAGRLPTHPDYDPRTLYIPQSEYKKMTPGQMQYWEIKSQNMDCVLFFKMGKFYELFDCDAEIGVQELHLNLMGKARLHAGFPEAAFDKYAEKLVHLGYKIARVEQTETVNAQKERKASGEKAMVVKRDLCSVLTPGTLLDPRLIGNDNANYLLSICENDSKSYGICVVDAGTAIFRIAHFEDDPSRAKLRTIIASLKIQEIIYPRECLSETTMAILQRDLDSAAWERKNPLKAGTEFWNATTTLKEIKTNDYFPEGKFPILLSSLECEFNKDSSLAELALSAVGGCVWYLRRVLLDIELISMGNFAMLDSCINSSSHLELDASSLNNLEILQTSEGSYNGSLLHLLDCTQSPFGKRVFCKWVTRPLCDVAIINERLDAVTELMHNMEFTSTMRAKLKKLPDLERLLARIHSLGMGRDKDAVMYSNVAAKNVKFFLSALKGFESSLEIMKEFEKESKNFTSNMLLSLQYPQIDTILLKIKNSFNEDDVVTTGLIIPNRGVNEEYDNNQDQIMEIKNNLAKYLTEQQRSFNDRSMKYFDKQKEPYQLEISKDRCKNIPNGYILLSSTKAVNRYWTNYIRESVASLQLLEEKISEIIGDVSRSFFMQFDESYEKFTDAIAILSTLDCLMALAIVSSHSDGVMCRPNFVESAERPVLDIQSSRHPAVVTNTSKPFVPNDIAIGGNNANFVLVTGPNMGGKSTLLRQTCIAVIMAQIGCYVPAEKCNLTVVDRIFTRIGAQDRILSGQSTFFVELEETSNILTNATKNSLVILDELGRGTSTFDGTAIAFSVISYIAHQIECRCLFSTHYHILTEDFRNDSNISMFHMSYIVNPEAHTVTFLYKFAEGVCSHSHGMNVAKLAGLPDLLVKRAIEQSNEFEILMRAANINEKFEKLMNAIQSDNSNEIALLQQS